MSLFQPSRGNAGSTADSYQSPPWGDAPPWNVGGTPVAQPVAVIGEIYAKGIDVAFLAGLAFAIAASANLPSILYSLFWQRSTERGAVEHLRRADHRGRPDRLLARDLRRQLVADHGPARQLRVLPAEQPRDRRHPGGILPRLARHRDRPAARRLGQVRPHASAGTYRGWRGERRSCLTQDSARGVNAWTCR